MGSVGMPVVEDETDTGPPSPSVCASISSGSRSPESWFLGHQAVLWCPGKIPLTSPVYPLDKLWP